MKAFFISIIIMICLSQTHGQPDIMLLPYPDEIERSEGKLYIKHDFSVDIKCPDNTRIVYNYQVFLRRLADRTGIFFSPDAFLKTHHKNALLNIQASSRDTMVIHADESYRLSISDQDITIMANTDIGVIHALETLIQMLEQDEKGYFFPETEIKDSPRFTWRGLLIDVCRHFMPVHVLKRNIDLMSFLKMNVLHLHLTEDQGFRIECKTFPGLHEKGSDGLYYTHEEIKDIIEYAEMKGMMVIPEFDIPGHTTSWFVAYPELASAPGPYNIERGFGIKDPAINPANEYSYEFLEAFFAEMSSIFPSNYIHIGGDEVNGKHWDSNVKIQGFMKENGIRDNHELQLYFNKRVIDILNKYNKNIIGWDEILNDGLDNDAIIQSWRGKEGLINAAKKGYYTILSNGYYIDLYQSAAFHYLNDPLAADNELSKKEAKYILGGEATMWSEYVTPLNIDLRIWPRTMAIAERLWSAQDKNDVDNMYKRLEHMNQVLETCGAEHMRSREIMLRNMIGSDQTAPLMSFIGLVEPVEGYARAQHRDYTTFSPLTRVVDACYSDAPAARHFRHSIDEYLSEPNETNYNHLRKELIDWQKNCKLLIHQIEHAPVLHEIRPLTEQIIHLSETALLALETFHYKKDKPGVEWNQQKLQMIEEAKIPVAEIEIRIVSAIEKLVIAMIYM